MTMNLAIDMFTIVYCGTLHTVLHDMTKREILKISFPPPL